MVVGGVIVNSPSDATGARQVSDALERVKARQDEWKPRFANAAIDAEDDTAVGELHGPLAGQPSRRQRRAPAFVQRLVAGVGRVVPVDSVSGAHAHALRAVRSFAQGLVEQREIGRGCAVPDAIHVVLHQLVVPVRLGVEVDGGVVAVDPVHLVGLSWSGRYLEPSEDGPARDVACISGAAAMIVISLGWVVERAFDVELPRPGTLVSTVRGVLS